MSDATWDEGEECWQPDRTEERPMSDVVPSYRITWKEVLEISYYDEEDTLVMGTREADCCMVLVDERKAYEMLKFMWSQHVHATMVHDDNLTLPLIRNGRRTWVWTDEHTS